MAAGVKGAKTFRLIGNGCNCRYRLVTPIGLRWAAANALRSKSEDKDDYAKAQRGARTYAA